MDAPADARKKTSMKRESSAFAQNLLAWPIAIGAIGLACAALLFHEFPLQDHPVPADLPGRSAMAAAASILLGSAGVLLLVGIKRARGAMTIAAVYGAWILAVELPAILGLPSVLGIWLGAAEPTVVIIGVLLLIWRPETRTGRHLVSGLFGTCLIVFGGCHFVYGDITAAMVPSWLPAPHAWAYATGTGHIVAGAAIASGIYARLAAAAWSAMCASFVLLVHLPRVAAHPEVHTEWTMLFMATSIAGAGWVIRSTLSGSSHPVRLLSARAGPSPAL